MAWGKMLSFTALLVHRLDYFTCADRNAAVFETPFKKSGLQITGSDYFGSEQAILKGTVTSSQSKFLSTSKSITNGSSSLVKNKVNTQQTR